MNLSGYQGNMITRAVTVASGQKFSTVIPLQGFSLVGIEFPATMDSTAVDIVGCTTQAGPFVEVNSSLDGSLLSFACAQGTILAIANPVLLGAVPFLKLRMGTDESADRTINVIMKGI